jgi:hypothetical protein
LGAVIWYELDFYSYASGVVNQITADTGRFLEVSIWETRGAVEDDAHTPAKGDA